MTISERDTNSRIFRRSGAARFLSDIGRPMTERGLQYWAQRGDGPPYTWFGRQTIYVESELCEWAARNSKARYGTARPSK